MNPDTDYLFPFDEYCERIGVSSTRDATLERLEELQRAHVYKIPFENLDSQLGRSVDLHPEHVDDKLIRKDRGGYCFEQNGLFLRVLKASGFQARRLLGRVHLGGDPSGRSHQLTLVRVKDRDWFVDVGFEAACPRMPIPLEYGVEYSHDGTLMRLVEHPLGYRLQNLHEGEWKALYSFDPAPVVERDIVMANYFTSTHPETHFQTSRIVTRCHPHGVTRLTNFRCLSIRHGEEVVEMLPDSETYLEELNNRFGIRLDVGYAAFKPVEVTT